MSEFPDSDLRVADTEREVALTALGEHMSAGRLNIDEYGERSAQVATAKTRGELRALFADLPEPHPRFGAGAPTTAPSAPPVPAPSRAVTPARPARLVLAGLIPATILIAVGGLVFLHMWYLFIIPAAIMVFGKAVWGENWRNERHHHDAREAAREAGEAARDAARDARDIARDVTRDIRDDYRQARRDYRRDRRGY